MGLTKDGENGLGEDSDAKGQQGVCRKFKKDKSTIIIFSLFLCSVIGNIIQGVQIRKSQATPYSSDGCFHGWSRHGDMCYFFSDEQRNWTFSHGNCSSYGASLVTLDPEEEWALIKSKEEEYWIDLQREKDQPWKWPDGSNVTQFDVKGTGFCGYVSSDLVSSTNCDNSRHWTCRKPFHVA